MYDKKFPIIVTLVGIAVISIGLTFNYFEADAFIGVPEIPNDGIIQERADYDISGGYTGVQFEKFIVVHISSGEPTTLHEVNSAERGIKNALALQDEKNRVVIYLDVDAVRIADENHIDSLNEVHEELKEFIVNGGEVILCDLCGGSVYVDSLLPGVEVDPTPNMPKLKEIMMEADLVLDY